VDVEEFITRWTAREGGAERANYQMFLSELCDVLDVPRPDPAGADREQNDYVFERAVRPRGSESTKNPKRIDLYNKGSFILERRRAEVPLACRRSRGRGPRHAGPAPARQPGGAAWLIRKLAQEVQLRAEIAGHRQIALLRRRVPASPTDLSA
jgi:hypothetical protein